MGTLTILNFSFSVFILYADQTLYWKTDKFYEISSCALLLNLIFLVDMIFNFIVLGFQNVWKEKRVIYVELLIQLSSFYYFFNFIDRNTDFNKYTEFTELAIVTMVRNVRAYNLLIETKAVCMIMETT